MSIPDSKESALTEENSQQSDLASASLTAESRAEVLPALLFDGYYVYSEGLSDAARLRTSPENVSDVLDAVVRLMRRDAQPPQDSPANSATSPNEQSGCSDCSRLREALTEILSIEPMSPEGGHEAVAEIHSIARAALKEKQ